MWRKFSNFEDDTHVPFMLRVPGVTDAGMRTSALVELIDIFPSLTDLAGVKVPPLYALKITKTCLLVWPADRPQTNLEEGASLNSLTPKPNSHEEAVMGYAIRSNT